MIARRMPTLARRRPTGRAGSAGRLCLGLIASGLILSGFATESRAADQLRIGVQFGMGYIPFYVAERDGLFKKHLAAQGIGDVPVTFNRFSGSPPLNDALISGQIDMAVYAITGLMVAWDKTRGTSSAIIGICSVMTHAASMVTLKPGLKTLKDVTEDDRIAIPSPISTSAYVLRMAAEKELGSGNAFDKQIVSMPNPEAVTTVLSRKVITALFTVPPFTDYVARQPGAHRVVTSPQLFGGPTSNVVLGSSQRFAEANPGLVKAVIAALDEANGRIAAEPRRAADIYLENEPSKTFDAPLIAELITDGEHGFGTTPLGVMNYVDYFIRHGEMKARPTSWKDLFLPYVADRSGS